MNRSKPNVHHILGYPLESPAVSLLNLASTNPDLAQLDIADNTALETYIFNGNIRIGGYLENRSLYAKSELFSGDEPRTIHLGIDIWTPNDHPIFAPLSGIIHGIGNNVGYGNYGPTLVVHHHWDDWSICALYGHLSQRTLDKWEVGDKVQAGEQLGSVGAECENGNWPPHLHFQLIRSLPIGFYDFPGVCKPSEVALYKNLCPNPNILLQSPLLTPTNFDDELPG